MKYAEALGEAGFIDGDLRADDPRFNHTVIVSLDDRTIMVLDSAFIEQHGEWYFIFTEHHKFFVFAKNDVFSIGQYKRVEYEQKG